MKNKEIERYNAEIESLTRDKIEKDIQLEEMNIELEKRCKNKKQGLVSIAINT